MKSDTPDELFVFPDSSSSIGEPNGKFLTPQDISDRKIRDFYLASLPWPPRFFISSDDLPY